MPIRLPLIAVVLLTACSRPSAETLVESSHVQDPHSFARPAEAAVKHVHLDLRTQAS